MVASLKLMLSHQKQGVHNGHIPNNSPFQRTKKSSKNSSKFFSAFKE